MIKNSELKKYAKEKGIRVSAGTDEALSSVCKSIIDLAIVAMQKDKVKTLNGDYLNKISFRME